MRAPTIERPRLTRAPILDRVKQALDATALNIRDVSPLGVNMNALTNGLTGGVIYNRRMELPVNAWKFRVYLANNSANMVNNATAIIPWDTTDFDESSGWNGTNFLYTIPISGTWFFEANINVNTSGANRDVLLWTIFLSHKRGATQIHNSQHNTVAGNNVGGSLSVAQTGYDTNVSDYFQCVAGDTIGAFAYIFVAPAAVFPITGGGAGGQYSYFGGHLISG